MNYKDKGIYIGEYVKGVKNGFGTFNLLNGDLY